MLFGGLKEEQSRSTETVCFRTVSISWRLLLKEESVNCGCTKNISNFFLRPRHWWRRYKDDRGSTTPHSDHHEIDKLAESSISVKRRKFINHDATALNTLGSPRAGFTTHLGATTRWHATASWRIRQYITTCSCKLYGQSKTTPGGQHLARLPIIHFRRGLWFASSTRNKGSEGICKRKKNQVKACTKQQERLKIINTWITLDQSRRRVHGIDRILSARYQPARLVLLFLLNFSSVILFIDLVGSNPTYIYIYYVCVFG
jgi:hypothetical protein